MISSSKALRGATSLTVVALAVAMLIASCDSREDGVGGNPAPSSAVLPSSERPPSPQGAVVSRSTFSGSSQLEGFGITRVVYRSTAGYRPGDINAVGSSTVGTFGTRVSGIVAVPAGAPPPGGWPIVALGHGTTGTDPSCGPSAHPDLLGQAGTVAALLRAGYVVAASDFQGLGIAEPGVGHPYLEPKTVAYNMIDMVRAARQVVPQASNRWAAMGTSQGGQAAWASAEFAGEYGAGLRFVGSVAMAPAVDLTAVTDGGVNLGYTPSQKIFLPVVMAGIATVYPNLAVSDYLRGVLTSRASDFTSCSDGYVQRRINAAFAIVAGNATPVSQQAVDRLHRVLEQYRLPQRRAAGPMLVIYGDQDDVVDPEWIRGAVRAACRRGDVVAAELKKGKGHTDLGANSEAIAWIGARFAGRPTASSCSASG